MRLAASIAPPTGRRSPICSSRRISSGRSTTGPAWVSLDVSHVLAYDTQQTVEAASSLHVVAVRPNCSSRFRGPNRASWRSRTPRDQRHAALLNERERESLLRAFVGFSARNAAANLPQRNASHAEGQVCGCRRQLVPRPIRIGRTAASNGHQFESPWFPGSRISATVPRVSASGRSLRSSF